MMRLGRPSVAVPVLRRSIRPPLAPGGLRRALCTVDSPAAGSVTAAADAAVKATDRAALQSSWDKLGRLLPHANLGRLVAQYPGVLDCEPSDLQSRVDALSAALPGQNVLRAVERCPTILQLGAEALRARARALVAATPRHDMALVVAESPELLEVSPEELAQRAAVLSAAYSYTRLMRIPRVTLAEMLRQPAVKLQRLAYLDEVYPGARRYNSGTAVVHMRQLAFEAAYPQRKTRRRGLVSPLHLQRRSLDPLHAVPPGVNPFRFGAEHAEAQAPRHATHAYMHACTHARTCCGTCSALDPASPRRRGSTQSRAWPSARGTRGCSLSPTGCSFPPYG